MHKRRPELYFVNLLLSVDKIKRNIKDISYEEFITGETIFGFVTRELQEIGESVKKLLGIYDLDVGEPGEVEWQEIVDFRMEDKSYLFQAIELTIPIYEKMGRADSAAYLRLALDRLR